MNNLGFVGKYKNKIVNILVNNEKVIKLIDPHENEDLDIQDVLIGGTFYVDGKKVKEQGYIFDYDFVSETTTEVKTFIEIECFVNRTENGMFNNFVLGLKIISHKDAIRLSKYTSPTNTEMIKDGVYTNRIDGLCSVIDSLLNGKSDMGIGNLSPIPSGFNQVYYPPNTKYYGKTLTYTVMNYNEQGDECGNN